MNLVSCRYNPNHKMKQTRLLIHEDTCPDSKGKTLKMCPFNPVHKLTPENYERHKQTCDQRPIVDKALEDELKEYLRSQIVEKNKPKISSPTKIKEESDAISKIPVMLVKATPSNLNTKPVENINKVGIRNGAVEKKSKRERKTKQKEMMNLIENTDFEESGILDHPSNNEVYEEEFININFANDNYNFFNFPGEENNTQFIQMIEKEEKKADYDPNESDIFITQDNKNNIVNQSQGEFGSSSQMKSFSMVTSNSIVFPDEN